jgi:hypothetical protein
MVQEFLSSEEGEAYEGEISKVKCAKPLQQFLFFFAVCTFSDGVRIFVLLFKPGHLLMVL